MKQNYKTNIGPKLADEIPGAVRSCKSYVQEANKTLTRG